MDFEQSDLLGVQIRMAIDWGPTYRNSYGICIATSGLTIGMLWVYRMHLERLNRELKAKGEQFRYML